MRSDPDDGTPAQRPGVGTRVALWRGRTDGDPHRATPSESVHGVVWRATRARGTGRGPGTCPASGRATPLTHILRSHHGGSGETGQGSEGTGSATRAPCDWDQRPAHLEVAVPVAAVVGGGVVQGRLGSVTVCLVASRAHQGPRRAPTTTRNRHTAVCVVHTSAAARARAPHSGPR